MEDWERIDNFAALFWNASLSTSPRAARHHLVMHSNGTNIAYLVSRINPKKVGAVIERLFRSAKPRDW
jgi:hypothetical protein